MCSLAGPVCFPGLVVIMIVILLFRDGADSSLTKPGDQSLVNAGFAILLMGGLAFLGFVLAWFLLEGLKICGWTAEMADLSNELRKRCLETAPKEGGEDAEDRKRRNLETCIKTLFLEDEDTSEERGKKWDIYIRPIMEDIVL
jgi:hypothetical protein